jgi:hypothetical protein
MTDYDAILDEVIQRVRASTSTMEDFIATLIAEREVARLSAGSKIFCQFFEVDKDKFDQVYQAPHPVEDSYINFLVPLKKGGAVRVCVCNHHLTILKRMYLTKEQAKDGMHLLRESPSD